MPKNAHEGELADFLPRRLTNATPFQDDPDQQSMEDRFRTRYLDWSLLNGKVSIECKRFIEGLLQENPLNRMSCAEALIHPWLLPLTIELEKGLTTEEEKARIARVSSSWFSTSSREAAAGSFNESDASFISSSTPRAANLSVAGMSGEFGQITMEDKDSENASADTKSSKTAIVPRKSQKLERRHMEVAEIDSTGRLKEFKDMDGASLPPDSPIPVSPAADNDPGTASSTTPASAGSRKRKERSQSLSQEKMKDGEADPGSTSDSSLLTPISDVAEDSAPVKGPTLRSANARKKAAPRNGRAPAKRTRASARQRGDDDEA